MSAVWLCVILVGTATIALKAAGPVLAAGRELPQGAARVVDLLAPALLAALVATQAFASDEALVLDERGAGLLAGGVAILLRAPAARGRADRRRHRGRPQGDLVSARGWALFAAVSVIWGMPYLFIKVAVDEMSPSVVAWSRLALAAAVLLPVAWKLGALRGLGQRWRILTVFAAIEMAIPWPLIGFGEVHISSSFAAILIAAVPLFVALIALRFDHSERPTPTRLVGMLIGLAGVAALVGIDVGGKTDELLGSLAVLVAAFCYAVGPMIVKRRLSDVDPLGPVAASLAIATLLVMPFALADLPDSTPSADALASIVVLGLICSALAFLLFFRLIAEIGPGRATVITYVNPVVALALGVAILDESVTAGVVVGLLLILAGSWLSTDGRVPPGLVGAGRSGPPPTPCTRFRGPQLAQALRYRPTSGRDRRRRGRVSRSQGMEALSAKKAWSARRHGVP